MALEECASCGRSPSSHRDIIHSIILCFSETEPYLNFLSLEEIENIQSSIVNGVSIEISPDIFDRAEEAFAAVELNNGPKLIQRFSKISSPLIAIIILTMLAFLLV
jgi:hypothetical protein